MSYDSVHRKLKKTRGSASGFDCLVCDERAKYWAYDYTDPNPLYRTSGNRKSPYSEDLRKYKPLCALHHVRNDRKYVPKENIVYGPWVRV